jgi:acetolactate decarboxylase
MHYQNLLLIIAVLFFACGGSDVPQFERSDNVYVAGSVKKVMKDKDFQNVLSLDTIEDRAGMYAVGLSSKGEGELTILDGIVYRATSDGDTIVVREVEMTSSPFLVYGWQTHWRKTLLPADITSLAELEAYLEDNADELPRPFIFKVEGTVDSATLHVKEGARDAKKATINNMDVEILGFYSHEDQGVITHHDSFIHAHMVTKDRVLMGHLESLVLREGGLWLPAKE